MYVLTVDQRGSRSEPDLVPEALAALDGVTGQDAVLPFERTTGDELQGVLEDPIVVLAAVTTLVRAGSWRIGIGIGAVDTPLPASTREARGRAFLAARQAVEAAHRSTQQLAVVSAHSYAEADPARLAETALWLTSSLLHRRTEEGWAVIDLLRTGLTQKDTAARLGISASAVSQRVRGAQWAEEQRAHELCAVLLTAADRGRDGPR